MTGSAAEMLNWRVNPYIGGMENDLEVRVLGEFESAGGGDATDLVRFLGDWVTDRFTRIELLHGFAEAFQQRFARAHDAREREEAILSLAEQLGASALELADSRKALRRFFDKDAVLERCRRRVGEEERAIVFAFGRIGSTVGWWMDACAEEASRWSSLRVEHVAAAARSYRGDPRVREASYRCLGTCAAAIALATGENRFSQHTEWEVQRAALDRSEPVWVQCAALGTLAHISRVAARHALERRFREPGAGDDVFVRRYAVRLLARNAALSEERDVLDLATADHSPAVRQAVASCLTAFGDETAAALIDRLSGDPSEQVRAAALADLIGLRQKLPLQRLCGTAVRALRDENSFVVRTALDACARLAWAVPPDEAAMISEALERPLELLRSSHSDLKVRRWAAQYAEQLWCAADQAARNLALDVASASSGVPEGKTFRVAGLPELAAREPDFVGRVFAVLAQFDFGLELLSSGRVRRGDLFAFRSWRLLHEWWNPSPDKRQAFSHWTGRVLRGRLAAPSLIMAELAPTKVPGEPLMQSEEGGWRNYLPLPDHVLSAIDTGGEVDFYSPEGVTVLKAPPTFIARLKARLRLTWRFADYAALRNWTSKSGGDSDQYAAALRELGVEMALQSYKRPAQQPDASTARFFSFGPLAAAPILWQQSKQYFSSIYANTLVHLGIFLIAALLLFTIKHFQVNRAMHTARNGIPLVIGGWGTRGKSGTERLKAAVFSALGHRMVSKTTGNEAMFLYAPAFGQVRELFLFRPYDKATIWEQLNLVRLSRKLGARVFLWECMGLTPAYVKVLQRDWMQDDIATITNTYPDHEDVQGPAGRNIPEVMTNFIPKESTLITSEEQMRPILRAAASELRTSFSAVGWLEAGLLPQEMLKRFPYEEHPYNIALVLELTKKLGLEPDYALKEMADRVVQDIGALKVYPEAAVRTRRLEFVLGNSANERFGALGNWSRLGFDRHDLLAEPDVWITTVVNNRADRVPRSRVFASILVKDISADRHVLIGSNLKGFIGFLEEAWNEHAPSLTLWPTDRPDANPVEQLQSHARWFRVAHSPDQVVRAVAAMVRRQPDGAGLAERIAGEAEPERAMALVEECGLPEAEGIIAQARRLSMQLGEYRALEERIRAGGTPSELNAALRDQLWRWFRAKIVVVENYHATGEAIVRQLVELTPPGLRNRIMGLQNIKGTGLDFVYRWHAWEVAYQACADALSEEPARAQRGLRILSSFQEFGVLSAEHVQATIDRLREASDLPGEVQRVQLELIEARLGEQLRLLDAEAASASNAGSKGRLGEWVEGLLDPGDAVRRRKRAELIYQDLAAERISSERAVVELRRLTARQKGGWLGGDVSRLRRRMSFEAGESRT